jgi:hypothetical protein
MKTIVGVMVAILMALLVASLWWAYGLWTTLEAVDMPIELWTALAGGVLFSLAIGAGLMALVFYSARRGYDDRVR